MDRSIVTELEQASSQLTSLLSAFSQESFNVVPYEGGWTAGQVAEHLFKSFKGMWRVFSGSSSDAGRDPAQMLDLMRSDLLNFDFKLQSPEFLLPPFQTYDQQTMIASIGSILKRLTDATESTDLSVLCTAAPFPKYGMLTRLEVLYFTLYHARRHMHQLKKIAGVLNIPISAEPAA